MKIKHTAHYKTMRRTQMKKDMQTLQDVSGVALLLLTVGLFAGIIYTSYPKGTMEGSALPYVTEDYYSPDDDYKPVPRPKDKPEWVKENAEFNMQLEEALR